MFLYCVECIAGATLTPTRRQTNCFIQKHKMDTLYIIGNGFDLFHNLPTGYDDFHKFVLSNNIPLSNTLKEFFTMKINSDSLWASFEEDLGSFDWQSFYNSNCNIDFNDDDFRPSFAYGLEDDLIEQAEEIKNNIRSTFEEWIESIDISQVKRKLQFLENSQFISFNYTLLLEEVYNIHYKNVLHLHGDVLRNSGELLFGHNITMDETPELDENGDSNRTMFTDSESAAKAPFHSFYKPVNEIIASNIGVFDTIKEIKDIDVLGHSLNNIDVPYFKEIYNRSISARWNVSYYDDKERERHFLTLLQIGIPAKSINLYQLTC